jgi:hypothetical protein
MLEVRPAVPAISTQLRLLRRAFFSLPRFFTVSNDVHVHSAQGEQFPPCIAPDYSVQHSRLPGLEGVCFSENGEILDSSDSDNDEDEDEDDLPSVGEIMARSRRAQVQTRPAGPAIGLTCDTDDDDTEVS